MSKICPFCKKELNALGSHLLYCKYVPKELSKEEIKIKSLEYNLPNKSSKQLIEDYNNLYSLPDLREKYDLDFKNILFVLKYYNIPTRSISESQQKISKNKIIKTCLEKYGVKNPSQVTEIQKKKEETFMKHYGVNNVWKTKEYAEFTSNRWKSYTPEKKSELIHKWTKIYGSVSKLENKIINVLNNLNIPLETQFKFPKYYHKYDIHLKNTNILIEVNGDFWHANPYIYKSIDILNFPNNKVLVKDLWEKDSKHFNYAIQQNYYVVIFWESEINEHEKNGDLEKFIIDYLNPYLNKLY